MSTRARTTAKATTPTVEETQVEKFVVPDLTVKDLLSAIPAHCFERSFFRSSLYVVWDLALVGTSAYLATTYIPQINPTNVSLPHPALYKAARFVAWAAYAFATGLPATGIWVIAHECGHQAFSTSKLANNTVGWILHSALGVPYHSWRISHGKHHAQTSHLTGDQVFVPKTRRDRGLPALNLDKENVEGTRVSADLQHAFAEALDDTPIKSILLLTGQLFWEVIISDVGVFLWLALIGLSVNTWGFLTVFRTYIMPYLWVNHWLVFITFLQHTDPALPHYQASSFTFPRGALSTFDRELMGGPGIWGKFCGFICGTATHGISETHVAHHIASKMPHYHAWEAKRCLEERLAREGMTIQGNPGTWSEALRIVQECKFIEDEGEVRFYKNANGKAARVAVFSSEGISDSGVDVQ
ncbi:hypothetical protein FRB97_008940 [Tulasnella sp. 331]|nr:hypothetical protein FRB97_008940 [Tulasnella sp. 331]